MLIKYNHAQDVTAIAIKRLKCQSQGLIPIRNQMIWRQLIIIVFQLLFGEKTELFIDKCIICVCMVTYQRTLRKLTERKLIRQSEDLSNGWTR